MRILYYLVYFKIKLSLENKYSAKEQHFYIILQKLKKKVSEIMKYTQTQLQKYESELFYHILHFKILMRLIISKSIFFIILLFLKKLEILHYYLNYDILYRMKFSGYLE